jgi:hypothetical protein
MCVLQTFSDYAMTSLSAIVDLQQDQREFEKAAKVFMQNNLTQYSSLLLTER